MRYAGVGLLDGLGSWSCYCFLVRSSRHVWCATLHFTVSDLAFRSFASSCLLLSPAARFSRPVISFGRCVGSVAPSAGLTHVRVFLCPSACCHSCPSKVLVFEMPLHLFLPFCFPSLTLCLCFVRLVLVDASAIPCCSSTIICSVHYFSIFLSFFL